MTAADHRPPRTPHVSPGGADLHVRDMTATFAADVTLTDAQARLAAVGQWLPVDGDPALPVGRLVDANSTGPLRLGFGAWRDLLLGVQFANGRGELITAGGRTVKNVAGYDLTKFVVGQREAFGRLATVTTRTYVRPAGAIVATFPPTADVLATLLPTPLRPQWAVRTADALHLGYLGDEPTLAFYADRLPSVGLLGVDRRTLDDDVGHRRSLWCFAGPATFRASMPPTRVCEFVRAAAVGRWSADEAFGVVVGDVPAGGVETILSAASAAGGSASVVDASTDPPRVIVTPASPAERDVVARLKRAFDPDGVLAPLPVGFAHERAFQR